MSAGPIKALVFDLGGVIVAHDNAVMHRAIAARCAAGWSPARVAERVGDERWGTGRVIEELHEELRGHTGYSGSWDDFSRDFCCHLMVDPSMLTFVERLAATRRVMIFSNTNAVHWNHVVAASGGRLGEFERHLSHEIGCAKPSARSFRMVSEIAGLDPAAMLFFDDVAANVEGARRAGLQAELFEGEARLRSRLAALELGLDG